MPEVYSVQLPDGRVISRQVPDGATDEQIRQAFADEMAAQGINAQQQQVLRPPPQHPMEISSRDPSIRERVTETVASLLTALGGFDERHAYRIGERASSALDWSPLGNLMGMEEGGSDFARGLRSGDVATAGLGALSFALSAIPGGGAVSGAVKEKGDDILRALLGDQSGAIRAWHGSPHDFDRFDMSKIGTGEGAQAYGHGLYFAENRNVAADYRNTLANPLVNGREMRLPEMWAYGALKNAYDGDLAAAVAKEEARVAAKRAAGASRNDLDDLEDRLGTLRAWQKHGLPEFTDNGRLYEVNINAEPEDFLDWDAPLVEQPRAIEALQGLDLSAFGEGNRTRRMLEMARDRTGQADLATGRELLNAISDYGDSRGVIEHQALLPHGLQGIRYLDQGSRGAGQGSRNFVVFRDDLVDILSKQ